MTDPDQPETRYELVAHFPGRKDPVAFRQEPDEPTARHTIAKLQDLLTRNGASRVIASDERTGSMVRLDLAEVITIRTTRPE